MTLVSCVDQGNDAIIDKSRDMGASWLCVAIAAWYWLFRPDAQVLLVSRVEDLVDRRGDPDCLMWKIDYMLDNLPDWMLPTDRREFQIGGRYRRHLLQDWQLNAAWAGNRVYEAKKPWDYAWCAEDNHLGLLGPPSKG